MTVSAREPGNPSAQLGDSPELREVHDQLYERAEADGVDIYGTPEDWSKVKRSGHFRRMEILDQLDLGGIGDKVAVDFGTGPWGFGCIFPKLRHAKRCISLDVSHKALEMAREHDSDIADKITYLVSEGEYIPLETDSVDIFWGGEVIEHVRYPRQFMQEVARVCKDGAIVVLSTPNRDPIYYAARGEDHTIGPEHIALMNYAEFQMVLADFCDNVEIMGYEISLDRAIDDLDFTQSQLIEIQRRAMLLPAAASGFISVSTVSKEKFHKNFRNYAFKEMLWNDPKMRSYENAEPMRLFEGIFGGNISPNYPFCFEFAGSVLIFLFWAHDWSGEVAIEIDGIERKYSLYSPYGGFRRIEIQNLDEIEHQIVIRRTGHRCAAAISDQTIFYKVIGYSNL